MKIVVTGALGHIGSSFIREGARLLKGSSIVMVDNLFTQRYCSLFDLPSSGNYTFLQKDILEADMKGIIKGADVVLHLAAVTDAENSFRNKDLVEKVNYGGTRRVAEACIENGVRMIHLSSTSVYGSQRKIVDENCVGEELKPQSPYAESKLKEEDFLREAGRGEGLKFVVLRFGTICGTSPGMRFHTAVNKFCWQAAMGEPISVWRTALHQKRPYLSIEDAIAAVVFVMEKDIFDGGVYNVLTDNLTVSDIIGEIKKFIPDAGINYVDTAIMNQLSYEVLCEKFRSKGFCFKGSIKKEIENTIKLLKNARTSG